MKKEIEVIGRYMVYCRAGRFHIESCKVFGEQRTSPIMDYTKTQLKTIVNPIWRVISSSGFRKVKLTVTIETDDE